MVTLEMTADPKALKIVREGKAIGHAMWHSDPLIQLDEGGWPDGQLSLSEIATVILEINRVRTLGRPGCTCTFSAETGEHWSVCPRHGEK